MVRGTVGNMEAAMVKVADMDRFWGGYSTDEVRSRIRDRPWQRSADGMTTGD
ncbi:hypothetical protein MESS2_p180002 [Mesorhizobium metallidurans STM 2683]|uniref:Uncharacterized protein n=1 Tax=Mesorhizobium metallidurans STM 2683 TaxID=1297569 RepID=M5EZ71_9HYPH|nr:hypothetical protein MESS2_p180002 [Mesorhizobium metallidurans STM 2683]